MKNNKFKMRETVYVKPLEMIKELAECDEYGTFWLNGISIDEGMQELCCTCQEIEECYEGGIYRIDNWYFTEEMLTDLQEAMEGGYPYPKNVSGITISSPNKIKTYEKPPIQNKLPVVRIKYFSDKIDELRLIDGKSDWMDLRAAEETVMKAGEYKLIPLGVGMKLPEGYEAHIVPRSSTFKNFGVLQTNCMGVIDNSYSGDNDQWMFPALAMRDTVVHVNDRICQFRIMKKQPEFSFQRVSHLDATDRGGFGSTGKQ